VWANQTEHNSIIFHDNDFELFVDPEGTNHYYKEFEVNANNVTWNLCLNKPYLDGGYENSTSNRSFGSKGWDMQPPLYCHTYVDGPVNRPNVANRYWSVEIALPLKDLALNNTNTAVPPKHGNMWRINFSRVEWHVIVVGNRYEKDPRYDQEDNWVWSKQGLINMHLPERWAVLQFSTEKVNTTAAEWYTQWPVRTVAMAVYDAEHAFKEKHGQFTADVAALVPFAPPYTLDGACLPVPVVTLNGTQFSAEVLFPAGNMIASIRDDRYLTVRLTADED
jgi:hypothetical protein